MSYSDSEQRRAAICEQYDGTYADVTQLLPLGPWGPQRLALYKHARTNIHIRRHPTICWAPLTWQPHLESSNPLPVLYRPTLSRPPPTHLFLLPPSPHTQTHTYFPPCSPAFSFCAYILSLTGPPLHGRIKVLGTRYTEHTTDYTCQLHDSIERHANTLLGLAFSWTGLTLGKI